MALQEQRWSLVTALQPREQVGTHRGCAVQTGRYSGRSTIRRTVFNDSCYSAGVRSWWRGVKKDRYESKPTTMAAMETLPSSM
jgi:hypothetical protein